MQQTMTRSDFHVKWLDATLNIGIQRTSYSFFMRRFDILFVLKSTFWSGNHVNPCKSSNVWWLVHFSCVLPLFSQFFSCSYLFWCELFSISGQALVERAQRQRSQQSQQSQRSNRSNRSKAPQQETMFWFRLGSISMDVNRRPQR